MPDIDKTVGVETTVIDTIHSLLERRGMGGLEVRTNSDLTADLGLDSLGLAQLVALLEEEFGRDPFAEGIVPDTVAELVEFYGS